MEAMVTKRATNADAEGSEYDDFCIVEPVTTARFVRHIKPSFRRYLLDGRSLHAVRAVSQSIGDLSAKAAF